MPRPKLRRFATRAGALAARTRIHELLGMPRCGCPKCTRGELFAECVCTPPAVNPACRYATHRWSRLIRRERPGQPGQYYYFLIIKPRVLAAYLAAGETMTGTEVDADWDLEADNDESDAA